VTSLINNAVNNIVNFDLSNITNATTAVIPPAAVRQIRNADHDIQIDLPSGSIFLSAEAASNTESLTKNNTVAVAVEEVVASNLPAAQRAAIQGNYDIFRVDVYSGNTRISEIDGITVIGFPFDGNNPIVWLLADDGTRVIIPSDFDEANGAVVFVTSDLGVFLIGEAPVM